MWSTIVLTDYWRSLSTELLLLPPFFSRKSSWSDSFQMEARSLYSAQKLPGSVGLHGWRMCLPMQKMWVRPLVREDPTCHGATRPVSHNGCSLRSRAPAPEQEKPRSRRTAEGAPLTATGESPRVAKTGGGQKQIDKLIKPKPLRDFWFHREQKSGLQRPISPLCCC